MKKNYQLLILLALFNNCALAAGQTGGGAFAQLYAPRPPAGSAFVRVATPGDQMTTVTIGTGREQQIGASQPTASRYAIVRGGQAFTINVDGQTITMDPVPAGQFTTVIAPSDSRKTTDLVVINDGSDITQDAMKAVLRLYNLSPSCPQAQLRVSPSNTVLIADVPASAMAARAVNPVQAELLSTCGMAHSTALQIPQLQPGEHYSLFLTGSPDALILRGQISQTDAPTP